MGKNKTNDMNEITGAKRELGLFDSATGEPVLADKMIDITHLCPDAKQVVIKYATVQRGRIAQICNWYKKGEDLGSHVHYFIDETNPFLLATDVVFSRTCRSVSANSVQVANFIYDNI